MPRQKRMYATIKSTGGKCSILKTRGTMAQEVEGCKYHCGKEKIRPFLHTDWSQFNAYLQTSLYWLKL